MWRLVVVMVLVSCKGNEQAKPAEATGKSTTVDAAAIVIQTPPDAQPTPPKLLPPDPLLGKWKAESKRMTLTIRQSGSRLVVDAKNPNGMVNGAFAGRRTEDGMELMYGKLTFNPDDGKIGWVQESFRRTGDGPPMIAITAASTLPVDFTGHWSSESGRVTLQIGKDGDDYVVVAKNPIGGLNGEFHGPGDLLGLAIESPYGGLAYLPEEGTLLWVGETFVRDGT